MLDSIFRDGNGNPVQFSCLANPMDGRAWWAAVRGVARSPTRLSNFTFTFHFHALEKEMATHSSVLAWRIPGTGEPGGLPSYGVAQSRTRLKRLSRSSSSRQHVKKQRCYFANKSPSSQGYGFPIVMYGCESWTIKKTERRRIDAFELWYWRILLRVPWTARRSNQSILKEIRKGNIH